MTSPPSARTIDEPSGASVSICLPPEDTLCKVCQSDQGCVLVGSLCIRGVGSYGYCGAVCNADLNDCPEGFHCALYKDEEEVPQGYQCLPEEGSCCAAGKWTGCDDDNPCTAEGCSPALGCLHDPLEGPCEGEDPCFLYECVDGECVGTAIVLDDTLNGLDDDCDGAVDEDAYKQFRITGAAFTAGGTEVTGGSELMGQSVLGSSGWLDTTTSNEFTLETGMLSVWKVAK